MFSRAKVSAAGALLGVLLSTPVSHADVEREYQRAVVTVLSQHNGRTSETFASAIKMSRARWDVRGASFAVLYLERRDAQRPGPDGVSIWLHTRDGVFQTTLGAPNGVLPSGRYRVSLFTTGHAAVRLPGALAKGGNTVRLLGPATGHVTTKSVLANQASTPPFSDSLARLNIPEVQAPLLVAAAVTSWTDAPAISYDFDECVVDHGSACSDADPTFGAGQSATMSAGKAEAELYATRKADISNADVVAEWKGTSPARVTMFVLLASRTR